MVGDEHLFGDVVACEPMQGDRPRADGDRRDDLHGQAQPDPVASGIVGVHKSVLAKASAHSPGLDPDSDRALPAGGDGPVEPDGSAPSGGSHVLNSQRLVTMVADGEAVLENFTLADLPEVMGGAGNAELGCGR